MYEHLVAIEKSPGKLVSIFNDNLYRIFLDYLSISFVQPKWLGVIDYENDLRKLISSIPIIGAHMCIGVFVIGFLCV